MRRREYCLIQGGTVTPSRCNTYVWHAQSVDFETIMKRWPHIREFLRLEPLGRIDADFSRWNLFPPNRADLADAHEEWADFFEWRLQQRDTELAANPVERHLLAVWTDSMAYCHRRLAAYARGGDPGEPIPQHLRRPDLDAESGATTTAIGTAEQTAGPGHHSARVPSGWRQRGLRQAGGLAAARRTAASSMATPRPGASVRTAYPSTKRNGVGSTT